MIGLTFRRSVEGKASNSSSESPPAGTFMAMRNTQELFSSPFSVSELVGDQGRRWSSQTPLDCALAWSAKCSVAFQGRGSSNKDQSELGRAQGIYDEHLL